MALVMSSHSRALFITTCTWSTSSGRHVGLVLGGNWDHAQGEMLAVSGVFNATGREGEWLTWTVCGTCSGVASPGEACEEVAIASGVAESFLSRQTGSSALVEGGCRWWFPFRYAMPQNRGLDSRCPLQLFQGLLEVWGSYCWGWGDWFCSH